MRDYSDITIESDDKGVRVIRLNRPEAHNALRTHLLAELADALSAAQQNDAIGCIVITGSETLFAAGADIKEMAQLDAVALWKDQRPLHWKSIREFTKPVVAAVNGYCLGGGFELAMHADILIAGSNAQFGQPEINLGIIPGAGGTQRLVRTVGKSLAMKMVLSGEFINAQQALAAGIAAEITQPENTLRCAIQLAQKIACKSPIALRLAKELVLKSYETTLEQGLDAERKSFVFLAATDDRNEGISAFLEKREPRFTGQ
ncbi:MAG: 2,3-dehydroadipyl-CoA hydratase [Sedimenticola sp.]|nr:MAG: 2,3-dehydroadipyl-CoA hydratase [Sedimenticola sp.]